MKYSLKKEKTNSKINFTKHASVVVVVVLIGPKYLSGNLYSIQHPKQLKYFLMKVNNQLSQIVLFGILRNHSLLRIH